MRGVGRTPERTSHAEAQSVGGCVVGGDVWLEVIMDYQVSELRFIDTQRIKHTIKIVQQALPSSRRSTLHLRQKPRQPIDIVMRRIICVADPARPVEPPSTSGGCCDFCVGQCFFGYFGVLDHSAEFFVVANVSAWASA